MSNFNGIENLPKGNAPETVVSGCIVLEGGAWRGLYTSGVLDVLMENGINLQTTIGVSAGALNGMNYTSGQIGRSIRINLSYRHDPDYCGLGAMRRDHGITGFSYLFHEVNDIDPLNTERFNSPNRRFVAVATDIETGEAAYFEKGKCSDIEKAVQASATVPYISEPVEIDGRYYLDGGLATRLPYEWALEQNFDKIVVIRTRDRNYRKGESHVKPLIRREYRHAEGAKEDLLEEVPRYNLMIDRLNVLENNGRIFVIAPSRPITISRFEGDMNALAEVYELGRMNAQDLLPELKQYLGMK